MNPQPSTSEARAPEPALGPELAVEIEWHAPDYVYAAGLVRDSRPWILDGALVGLGPTRGKAVDDLMRLARHLVVHGENYLTPAPLSLADREWLFTVLDRGRDPNIDMWAALQAARLEARETAPVTTGKDQNQ